MPDISNVQAYMTQRHRVQHQSHSHTYHKSIITNKTFFLQFTTDERVCTKHQTTFQGRNVHVTEKKTGTAQFT
jgi:hypothetical protein